MKGFNVLASLTWNSKPWPMSVCNTDLNPRCCSVITIIWHRLDQACNPRRYVRSFCNSFWGNLLPKIIYHRHSTGFQNWRTFTLDTTSVADEISAFSNAPYQNFAKSIHDTTSKLLPALSALIGFRPTNLHCWIW